MSDNLVKRLRDDLVKRRRDTAHGVRLSREAADRIEELEAKLAQGIVVEYDDGSRICLSAFAGGASEGGAWSHLTLMKEEQDGTASFRHYTADGDWCSALVFFDTPELEQKP